MEMETQERDAVVMNGGDDFFDGDHGHAKQNGEIPATMAEDIPPKEQEGDGDGPKEGGGDGLKEAGADENHKVDDENSPPCSDDKQDEDAVAASGGEGGDGAPAAPPEGDEGGQPAEAAHAQEEQVDGIDAEGFQSTSPPPTTQVSSNQEEAEAPTEQGEEHAGEPQAETQQTTEQETKESSEPAAEENVPTDDATETTKEDEGQGHAAEGQGDVPATKEEDKEEKEEEEKPQQEMAIDGNQDYDDSFSECSGKSFVSIDSTGKTMNPKIETVKSEEKEQVAEEQEQIDDVVLLEPKTIDEEASVCPPCPSPSLSDSRAEAASVVPVVVEQQAADGHNKTDGRSSAEPTENGEFRGEDRSEISPPEGTEDSRGQGQWKTQEQQYIASAVLAHKSETEAMQELQGERDQLLEDQQAMKASLDTLEKEVERKNDLLVAEQVISTGKERKIKELQEELDLLSSKNTEGSEERIKELQERLAVLARENDEKDQQIHRLNEELKMAGTRLKDTERKLDLSEQANNASNSDAPKSKTCAIM